MNVPRWVVPIVVLVFLFGSIVVGNAADWWQMQGADLRSLEGATPDDIRGSSTLASISAGFTIPMDELLTLLNLPADTSPDAQLKDLETYNEVSTVRGLVAGYLGLPTDAESVPESAPEGASADAATPTAVATAEATPTRTPDGEDATVEIRGSTTLQEVSDTTGLPLDVLYKELGLSTDVPPTTALRDLKALTPGFEVDAVRVLVEAYQVEH